MVMVMVIKIEYSYYLWNHRADPVSSIGSNRLIVVFPLMRIKRRIALGKGGNRLCTGMFRAFWLSKNKEIERCKTGSCR
jgi:hypothetical protein